MPTTPMNIQDPKTRTDVNPSPSEPNEESPMNTNIETDPEWTDAEGPMEASGFEMREVNEYQVAP